MHWYIQSCGRSRSVCIDISRVFSPGWEERDLEPINESHLDQTLEKKRITILFWPIKKLGPPSYHFIIIAYFWLQSAALSITRGRKEGNKSEAPFALQATHTWKFVTLPNIFCGCTYDFIFLDLVIPPLIALLGHPVQNNIFFPYIK